MGIGLLIAIVIAFGIDPPAASPGAMGPAEVARGFGGLAVGLAVPFAAALVMGRRLAARARREGASGAVRRGVIAAGRVVEGLNLTAFAWIVHDLGWPAVVASGLGLRDAIAADEALVLAPFLVAQLLGWLALEPAERALARARGERGESRARHLVRRARAASGLILPVLLVAAVGQDVLRRAWPGGAEDPRVQLAGMAVIGAAVLILAPAFVRLAWPARPLPPGPLRDRLERLAARLRFRCTDILVWETGGAQVNAVVTGAVPWFRYVLLTDALIAELDGHQVEAVFGHEVGHVAHRHLPYFGLFFLGSAAVMAMLAEGLDRLIAPGSPGGPWSWAAALVPMAQTAAWLAGLGLYLLVVFGFLSRRFERQADLYGCRAVSCHRPSCPPHGDVNAPAPAATVPLPADVCPVGIRIFAATLADVARLNGLPMQSRWAWRHGSIARRIAFLEGLEGRPDAARRFDRAVRRLRLGMAVALAAACAAAVALGGLS